MNRTKKNTSFFINGLIILLIGFLLFPIGLKLEHSFSFHSQKKECKHSKTHFHSSDFHNHLIDMFFQTLVKYDFGYKNLLNQINVSKKDVFIYEYLNNEFSLNKLRVRGPPFI